MVDVSKKRILFWFSRCSQVMRGRAWADTALMFLDPLLSVGKTSSDMWEDILFCNCLSLSGGDAPSFYKGISVKGFLCL